MLALFDFLHDQPYVLLFAVVGAAFALGQVTVRGYGLGVTASAIVIGTAVSATASAWGVVLELDEFTKLLFYYLFMYAVGLRVGPAFVSGLKGDGIKFAALAVLCSVAGLLLSVGLARGLGLPPGAAPGILAGAMTMSSALGAAEQAIASGAWLPPDGFTAQQVSATLTLAYGVTYVWGTVGIILIVKYLPQMFGVDAVAAAREVEAKLGTVTDDTAGGVGWQPFSGRAYRLVNADTVGRTLGSLRAAFPEYRWLAVERAGTSLDAHDDLALVAGDVVMLFGATAALTEHIGLIGPEVTDAKALRQPLDRADVMVMNPAFVAQSVRDLRQRYGAALQVVALRRGGHPLPIGPDVRPQRGDVIDVIGPTAAVGALGRAAGTIARPSAATDLFVLSIGMVLGFLIGAVEVPIAGIPVGLGAAGGLLVSGVAVASLLGRFPLYPQTPTPARQLMEDLGLTVFVAIVGINVGADLLAQLSGTVAAKIFFAGFVVTTLPPILVWIAGAYGMKLNAAILMGATAGARSHSAPCREAADAVGSSVPWIGFSVGYAVSGVLLTVFGHVALLL
ncbi:MAG: transporter [Burkholderiales bacterium]|jgi:putative transport protein|nr:transporter [Burkholderiales bacterium]